MHHGKAIDQDGDVVTIGVFRTAFALSNLVLVNDLQPVVMDICFIQQSDVFARAVVTRKNLNVVFVDATGLLFDSVVGAGDAGAIEPFPFRVAKRDVVESFELTAQVGNEVCFAVDGQVVVGLRLEDVDEFLLQLRLGLVVLRDALLGLVLRYDGALLTDSNRVVLVTRRLPTPSWFMLPIP